jgi:hypothetical protein
MSKPTYDQDAAGGPTHQPSVQPGAAHLPVRGQPTIFTGEGVQMQVPERDVTREHRPMTYADFTERWPRFSGRLAATLKHDGHKLRRQGIRLQIGMSVCAQQETGVVLNAAVTLVRNGLRGTSVAGLHVTALPERRDERSLAGLSHELNAAADAWLRNDSPRGILPVFAYPRETRPLL